MKYLFLLLLILFISCNSTNDVSWTDENGFVIIQLDKVDPAVETYFAEITLESGSRIAVELGLPDKERKFRILNNFGSFKNIEIYTNLDL